MTRPEKLSELNIGDKFYPRSKIDKATPIFEVMKGEMGNLRRCKNLQTGEEVFKSGSLLIVLKYQHSK